MLRPYVRVLSTPGAPVFSGAGFVARMPIAMVGLGIVLLVVAEHGSYGLAGALSATFALVNAMSAPLLARLVDRLGQRRVLAPAVLVTASGLVAFVLLASAGAPLWALYAAVTWAGLAAPSIGSMVRARWGHALGSGSAGLHTAYALESVLDEAIFVVGPLLATVLATQLAPQSAVLTAAVLLVAGSAALLSHRRSEPPVGWEAGAPHPSALRSPGLLALMAVLFFLGAVFGAVEISTVAFADEAGDRSDAGWLLATYALGSMLSGLAFGAIHWSVSARLRLAIGAAVMTATAVPLVWAGSLPVLTVLLFFAGVGIAPTLISALSLVERIVPRESVTEGLTWSTTGLVVGFSLATWLAGRLVDTAGVATAYTLGGTAAATALASCALFWKKLPR